MREVEDSARGKWWPLPFSARAETAVSTAFMGGFHGRAFFNRSSTRLEPSGKGKRRGAAGTVAPRRPANGLGMRKAMEEIWEIYPWLSIRVPFSRTARRGRPCLACGRLGEAVPAMRAWRIGSCLFMSILVGLAGARRTAIPRRTSLAPHERDFPGYRSICSPDPRRSGSGDRRNRVANRFRVSGR